MKIFKTILAVCFLFVIVFSSCKKDELLTDSNAKLEFSKDTVFFDTVFTTVGSTTKIFKIYNRHSQPINISKIYLPSGANSQFRINVDGTNGTLISNIEILPNDSLFVFVQVTVNPLNSNSPMVVLDSVMFETNGNVQEVILMAVGQDVHLHKPNLPADKPWYSIISCNDVWTNDKPHLIFGYAVVDSACTLTMMPGTKVHLNVGGVLWVYKAGKLDIQGTHNNEVVIQGSRLEPEYKEFPGQWGAIWLSRECKSSSIDWAIIKNGAIGVRADTFATAGIPTLNITNTIIRNMEAAAILGQGSHIRAVNCVFANCGQAVAALTIGGKYKFMQCTFANFWPNNRSTPLLVLNNYYEAQGNLYVIRDLDSAYFGNCILYGNLNEEIGLDSSIFPGGAFSYKFENCILKTELNTSKTTYYVNVHKNLNPGFKDYSINDYQLITGGGAIDKGFTVPLYQFDLNNKTRPNLSISPFPDLGAYEFYP